MLKKQDPKQKQNKKSSVKCKIHWLKATENHCKNYGNHSECLNLFHSFKIWALSTAWNLTG